MIGRTTQNDKYFGEIYDTIAKNHSGCETKHYTVFLKHGDTGWCEKVGLRYEL
jgi:hypothetical protein